MYLSLRYSAVTQRPGTYPVVLYCHGETWCLSLRYSTDTKRHGTCPCGVLLSHKDTIPVRVVLYFHPEARCMYVLPPRNTVSLPVYSIVTKRRTCPCGTQLSTRDTGPVPVVLYCTNVTQIHGNSPCATLLSTRYTILVPVILYCNPETWCLSLWFSTVTHSHGTLLYCLTKTRHGNCRPCGVLLSHKDTVSVPAVFYVTQRHGASPCDIIQRHGASPCGDLLSYKDTVPVPVVLYCHTKTRYLSL